jgi:hypothetical protein
MTLVKKLLRRPRCLRAARSAQGQAKRRPSARTPPGGLDPLIHKPRPTLAQLLRGLHGPSVQCVDAINQTT